MQKNYYADKLNASMLFQVYDTSISRVKQHLDAEISFVCNQLCGTESVLELAAGFGRIMKQISPFASSVTGIDICESTVQLGKEHLKGCPNCHLEVMDVHNLMLTEKFDIVLCLQNGISAVKGDSVQLMQKAANLLKSGGKAFFSTYSPNFWEWRLEWFQEQADKGLLGAIDLQKSKNGSIVCKDGFVSAAYSADDLKLLGDAVGFRYEICEIDDSLLFLTIFN